MTNICINTVYTTKDIVILLQYSEIILHGCAFQASIQNVFERIKGTLLALLLHFK